MTVDSVFPAVPGVTVTKTAMMGVMKTTAVRESTRRYTVEPLAKDTPNKGHLFIEDTCFDLMLILSCII